MVLSHFCEAPLSVTYSSASVHVFRSHSSDMGRYGWRLLGLSYHLTCALFQSHFRGTTSHLSITNYFLSKMWSSLIAVAKCPCGLKIWCTLLLIASLEQSTLVGLLSFCTYNVDRRLKVSKKNLWHYCIESWPLCLLHYSDFSSSCVTLNNVSHSKGDLNAQLLHRW